MDLSAKDCLAKKAVAEATVGEMGGGNLPVVLCFNKCDLVPEQTLSQYKLSWPGAVFISAAKGEGVESLRNAIKASFGIKPDFFFSGETSGTGN